jgi:endoglucanase
MEKAVNPAWGLAGFERKGSYEMVMRRRIGLVMVAGLFYSGIAYGEVTIGKPKNAEQECIKAYKRVLSPPSEVGLTVGVPRGWLEEAGKLLEEKKKDQARRALGSVEDWLGLRSRLYDLTDKHRHLLIFSRVMGYVPDKNLETALNKSMESLNRGNLEESRKKIEELENIFPKIEKEIIHTYGYSFFPGISRNPYGWIKSFTTLNMGVKKYSDSAHPAPVFSMEPSPFGVCWEDGFSFSLLDENATSNPPLQFGKSWVTTQWQGPSTFTFSVLTPLILAEKIDRLFLGKLSIVPNQLIFMTQNNQVKSIPLSPSFDYTFSKGEMTKNWLVLKGEKFTPLLIALERQPSALTVKGNIISFSFPEKTFAALLRFSSQGSLENLAAEAKFWSRVSLAPPIQAVESVNQNEVSYRYFYGEHRDEWGTQPLRIAPVPPLADLGHIHIEGVKRTKIATRYGFFTYLPGEKISFKVPTAKTKLLRGGNLAISQDERKFKEFADHGLDFVRLFISSDWDGFRPRNPEEEKRVYSTLDSALKICRKYNLKVLMDPHWYGWTFHEGSLPPTDPRERKKFSDLWGKLAAACVPYKDIVVGYDLYNEPHTDHLAMIALEKEAMKAIRKIDPDTPIYIESIGGADPGGFWCMTPLGIPKVVYSFHFYYPHSFTDQKGFLGNPAFPHVFYPGWISPIDWAGKDYYENGALEWWDRWQVGASMIPVLEFAAKYKKAVNCGEFAPVGYVKPKAAYCGGIWTRDAIDWFERYDISWNIWSWGWGLEIPEVASEVFSRGQKK